jgi:hypothetical protein
MCAVAACEPCVPCFAHYLTCSYAAADLVSANVTIAVGSEGRVLEAQIFSKMTSRCNGVASGLYCTPLVHDTVDPITQKVTTEDMTVEECVVYCDGIMGDDLVSVHTERVQAGHCCCHHAASCECLGAAATREGNNEVAIVHNNALPEKRCPTSLVFGAVLRDQ